MAQLTTPTKNYMKDHFIALYDIMNENNDHNSAADLLDVYEKFKNNELIITFAGHFSAGKSSMINTLLEEDILPNSPIPTSANIVKITSGEGYARVFFHKEAPLEYKAPYDIDMIKEYCQNKDTIKLIELSTENKILPEGCVIIDTPGIDAADDADRLLTESSLHLVDLLFYVMDYNHVQSEVNLLFLKQLQEQRIPFYLIVNQIDKHREEEITFGAFKESIKQTFNQWGISPQGVYYTSLIDHNLPTNEFMNFKKNLFHILHNQKHSFQDFNRSVHHVIDEHKQFLHDIYDEQMNDLNVKHSSGLDEVDVLQTKEALTNLRQQFTQFEQEFRQELSTTLNNAYLMPFEMRKKAQAFLESQQSDFKVGWLRTKQKTKIEREKRLNDFWTSLHSTIESTITWRLREKFKRLFDHYELTDEKVIYFSQYLSSDFSAQHLVQLVNPGARVTGEYVLNYTDQVSTAIKQTFKREADHLWAMIQEIYDQRISKQTTLVKTQQKELDQIKNVEAERTHIQTTLQQQLDVIDQILVQPNIELLNVDTIEEAVNAKYEHLTHAQTPLKEHRQEVITHQPEVNDEATYQESHTPSIQQTVDTIEQTLRTIETLPGFQSIVNDLKEKQKRLTHRTLTVALFGAFSAGKSSFANALMGEYVLPVSPNPTTAVVTRIHPVTNDHPHGTVLITLKSEEEMVADLQMLTKDFSPPQCSLHELIQWIEKEKIAQNDRLNQMFQAYIHAVMKGYKQMSDQLGRDMTIHMEDFASFSTDESKACFIKRIDLYYACSITNEGITLVDTPGADSVNARHTDVSFNFIKDADAIIYVTYYNHALSRADKEFLLQLGRVKESFELDKMFFVINAADLATTKDELDLVVTYVRDELQHLGIRFPTIFPLSSKQALQNKLNHEPLNEQMATFESAFHQFIHYDLATLVTQSALWDIKRAYQSLKQYIAAAQLNEQERKAYEETIYKNFNELQEMVEEEAQTIYIKQLKERIHRQLHFVQQRFSIRFHDFYRDTFNPTTITSSKRHELESCLRQLLDQSGYELLQEMRAVSLRVEATIRSLATDVYDVFKQKSHSIDEQFILPMYDIVDIDTPNYEQAFEKLPLSTFNQALKLFRGTKSFFERNEKDVMKEEIYSLLIPYIEQYIDEQKQLMEQAYMREWKHIFTDLQQHTRKHIDAYVSQQKAMLNDSIDQYMLEEKERTLQLIIQENKIGKDNS